MTDQIQKILSNYQSENVGVLNNLARILNHGHLSGTGKLVILPVDQGFEHGPLTSFISHPPAFDPLYHFQLAIQAGCSAYAAPLGFLQAGAKQFIGQIPLILKANNSDSLYKSDTSPFPSVTGFIDQALQLGCVGIGFTIYPGGDNSFKMYEQIARIARQARRVGLVVVIWSYPRGRGISKKGEIALDVISYAAHIAAQLGAHIIKVKPPQNFIEDSRLRKHFPNSWINKLSHRVRIVIQSAFNGRRIVIFSGGPSKNSSSLLQEVKELAKGGSFGSIIGRNAFKRPLKESLNLLKQIMDIYKKHDC